MKSALEQLILRSTGAEGITGYDEIQSLWSGYGQILRVSLDHPSLQSVIAKHVDPPHSGNHPRGWNTNISHERKLRSYQVETHWYEHWSVKCNDLCRVPQCLAIETQGDEVFMVLEDLNAAGYPLRKSSISWQGVQSCLSWLANFHATFLHEPPLGLWEIGTYWHLDTRPDELEGLDDGPLKRAAASIDMRLNQCPFQTFVHGDAKLANFCFSEHPDRVAAVDFQYVGGGCGMKDVAYFVGSCMSERDCERLEDEILQTYFEAMEAALCRLGQRIDFVDLKQSWTGLYPLAWTDFHRFLKGWSPCHWKINDYSERIAREVIEQLQTSLS